MQAWRKWATKFSTLCCVLPPANGRRANGSATRSLFPGALGRLCKGYSMKLLATLLTITAAYAAELSGFDKTTLEAYLRHVELWVPGVAVQIDDAKESKELPGFLDVTVHLSYNNTTPPPLHYFMSKDGKKIFRAEVYDIDKS